MTTSDSLLLFSVDVEDFPVILRGQEAYAGRVPELIERYLAFLRNLGVKATFFVLGETAEKNPNLIPMLKAEGHEIGSHGYSHIPLDQHTPESFREDLRRSVKVLEGLGAPRITGYRAPFLSLTRKTAWAYSILATEGFKYSSSVLPRYNPLYSWPGFGSAPKQQDSGVWEFPLTVMPLLPFGVPVMGGVYFRVLPFFIVSWMMKRRLKQAAPILGYFHPYDLDWDPESRTCSWLRNNPVGNYLIFYNRKDLLSRLEKVVSNSVRMLTYKDYLEKTFLAPG